MGSVGVFEGMNGEFSLVGDDGWWWDRGRFEEKWGVVNLKSFR